MTMSNLLTTPATMTTPPPPGEWMPPPALQPYYTQRHQRQIDVGRAGLPGSLLMADDRYEMRLARLGGIGANMQGTGAINLNLFRTAIRNGESEAAALAAAIINPAGVTVDGVPLQQRFAEQLALEQAGAEAIHGRSMMIEPLIQLRMLHWAPLGAGARARAVREVARDDIGLSRAAAEELAKPRLHVPISAIHAFRPRPAGPVPGYGGTPYDPAYAQPNPYAGLGPPPYAGLGPPPVVAGTVIGATRSPWGRLYPWM